MIILNINDLLKFSLESVSNCVGVVTLMLLVFFLLTSAFTIVSEKVGTVICTIIGVYRAAIQIEKDEKND